MRPARAALAAGRCALAGVALQRLARGRERRPPLAPLGPAVELPPISVVTPARDEADRIAGVLGPLTGAPGVVEVLVVDDCSSDGTADVARALGASVVEGGDLPTGWVGKPWALQQGLVAAKGEIVVFLDADVRPDPELPRAVAELIVAGADLASAQLRFDCPDPAQRVIHPALLTTLVYRVGPLDTVARIPASVVAINGQCFAARRDALIRAGGFGVIAGVPTDDVALARALKAAGWRIAVADGSRLGTTRMYESADEALREWGGRSLALPGAASRPRQLLDLGVVWAVQGLPGLQLWRALATLVVTASPRRAASVLRPRDWALLGIRFALQGALTRVYRRGRVGVDPADGAADPALDATRPDLLAALAPLVDPVAAAALTRGTFAPVRRWRGRDL